MADVDIAVDSGDLKAAIELLNEYGLSFTSMVSKVQTESNKLARASKATSDQITQAWKNAEDVINTRHLEEQLKKEAALLKQQADRRKHVVDLLKQQADRRAAQEKAAADAAAKALQNAVAEEGRILSLREQQWKQFFQQDYMKNQSASKAGAPTNANSSAFTDQLREEEQQAKETAAALAVLEKEKKQLTISYNPLVAAGQKYNQMQAEINRANQLGIISDKQRESSLEQLKKEYTALSQGVYLSGSRFNQFGEMAGGAGKSASRFGMYAQQAGYQIGDFAVQLQSGTNAGVAFSQQAAQLAGLIPGLAGALTTFAAIGLGLLIQNLTRGEKEAKETYAQLSKFEDLEAIFKTVGTSFETSMVQSISRVRKEYGDFVADMAKFELQKELDQLKANLGTSLNKATANNPNANTGFVGRRLNEFAMGTSEGIEALQKQADEYNAILAQVITAQDQLFSGDINSKQELVDTYVNVYETIQKIPGVSKEILDRFKEVAVEAGIWNDVQQAIGDKQKAIADKAKAAFDLYKEMNEEQRLSNELAAVKYKHGENSLFYLDAEKAQQLQIYQLELERAGVKDSLIEKLVSMREIQIDYEQYAERARLTQELMLEILQEISGIDISVVFTRAQAAADGLLGTVNAIRKGMSQMGKLALEAQALKAQSDALAGGKSPGQARIEGDTVRYGHSLEGVPNWLKPAMKTAFQMQSNQNLEMEEDISADTKSWNDANKPKKGGKGKKPKKSDAEKDFEKAQEKLQDFMEKFELNIEQYQRLSGVFGEQREKLEKVIEIENRLGDARGLVSQKQIEAWAEEERALEQKLERERTLYEIGSQNFENLLMNIVNGTGSIEDAFKAMLSNIIADIYQNFVAKQAGEVVGGWFSGLLAANGHAFNGAGQVQYFANGGVVNAPTAFKHSGGLGVMGEAGPEAIMPLKRNSQGKLGVQVSGGGSGDVHITQVFQMSANGDEAVRAIIRQETPKIAQQAKNAVIEAKRRNERGFN